MRRGSRNRDDIRCICLYMSVVSIRPQCFGFAESGLAAAIVTSSHRYEDLLFYVEEQYNRCMVPLTVVKNQKRKDTSNVSGDMQSCKCHDMTSPLSFL